MNKYDAVIAGYTCVDLTVDFKTETSLTSISDLLKPGKLIEIDGLSFSLGGLVANTGIAMKKFNKKVYLNGLIGDDYLGKIIREWFDRYELSEGIKSSPKEGTAISIVLAPPWVDRIFLESAGCNHIFDNSYIDFEAISQSRLFHFGYPPLLEQFYQNEGDQLVDMFSRIQGMGVVTSLDFSLPDPESESGKLNWQQIMHRTFPYIDVFMPSLEETLQIMMPEKLSELQSASDNGEITDKIPVSVIREIGKQIIESGVRILLIKAGHCGAYIMTGDISSINEKPGINLREESWNHIELWCNAYNADSSKIINTCGAGDTAAAAFLSAILDGENPEASIKYATIAGRNNLYCHNIYDDLRDWQEMTDEMESELNKIISFKSAENKGLFDRSISELNNFPYLIK